MRGLRGFLDVVDNKASAFKLNKTRVVDESRIYRDREESFSRELAFQTCRTTRPDEWWRTYGYSTPQLQEFAIKILSQTSTSSGCERNWSVFERIHTKRRNRLEHQRLNDLVFIHYNLRLKNRMCYKKSSCDPIDYESIDRTEFWIADDEQEGDDFNLDELEQALYEEGSIPVGVDGQPYYDSAGGSQVDGDDNDDDSDDDVDNQFRMG
ncbi:uncharacterized protein LOC116142517 [Pistacia vera]|uniref:uncharacterized protein LOC116142517 n=1 Tax=Pistacia vera TaxID=55513 RepID=UPI001263201D|nr:uncharacterized protein LOC116142517 [Pistacia vera]